MGYLAAKDTGLAEIYNNGNLMTGDVNSPDGATNPTTNNGITNIRIYKISFDIGKSVNVSPNIAGQTTRISVGSKTAVPVNLLARFSRKIRDRTASKISVDYLDTISYFSAWSRNRTIIMLFYMPNSYIASTSELRYGQEIDFYGSQLKTLYDVLIDNNVGTDPYGATTYGTIRYKPGNTIDGSDYEACAVPIIVEKVTVTELGESNMVDVNVTGYVVENEGK